MLKHIPIFSIVVCGLIAGVSGCGNSQSPTFPVTGTVKFKDGKPVANGVIEFSQTGVQHPVTARGVLDSSGQYTLGTYTAGDGAMAGEYRVAVFPGSVVTTGAERPGEIEKLVMDPKFSDVDTSELTATVKEEPNDFPFTVDYAAEGN